MTENPTDRKSDADVSPSWDMYDDDMSFGERIRNFFFRGDRDPVEPEDLEERGFIETECRRIGYRLARILGDVVAVVLGLAFVWFYILTVILANGKTDISFVGRNAEIWFSEAFSGHDAEIGSLTVEWKSVENTLTFEASDVSVKDKNNREIENLARLSSTVKIGTALRGRLTAETVAIDGGVVSWVREEDGRINAGIGTPDTVGSIGPVWRGGRAEVARESAFPDMLNHITISNGTAHVVDKRDGLNRIINDAFVEYTHIDGKRSVLITGNAGEPNAPAPFNVEFKTNTALDALEVIFTAVNINPSEVLPLRGNLSKFKALDAPVEMNIVLFANDDVGLTYVKGNIDIEAGNIKTSNSLAPLNGVSLDVDFIPDTGSLAVTNLVIDTDPIKAVGELDLKGINLFSRNVTPNPIGYDVRVSDITVDVPSVFVAPLTLSTVTSTGEVEPRFNRLKFENLTANFDNFTIDLNGFATQDEAGKLNGLTLRGGVDDPLSPEDLLSIWPWKFADGARRWMEKAFLKGNVSDLVLRLDARTRHFSGAPFEPETARMDFKVNDADVRYISTMPIFSGASAVGKVVGNTFEMTSKGGQVDSIEIPEGHINIPELMTHGSDLIIDIKGVGEVPDLLKLIDSKPFEFVSQYGVNPDDFSGQGEIDLNIKRPLLEHFDQSRVEYSATGRFTNVSAPFSVGDFAITDGNVDINVDKTGMKVEGPVNIGVWKANLLWQEIFDEGATPTRYSLKGRMGNEVLDTLGVGLRKYIGGDIDVDILATGTGVNVSQASIRADLTPTELSIDPYWGKAIGETGSLNGTLKRGEAGDILIENAKLSAPGLALNGALELAPNLQLVRFEASNVKVEGFVEGQLSAYPTPEGDAIKVDLTGPFLDISPAVSSAIKVQSDAPSLPIDLTANLDRLILSDNLIIQDAQALYINKGVGVEFLSFKGDTEDGNFVAKLEPDFEEGLRRITLTVPNAEKVAKSFFGLNQISKGLFTATAELPPVGIEGPLRGTVNVVDFTLLDAPILAQMLSLASLQGVSDVLGGAGLKFDVLELPFLWNDGVLSLREARAFGAALGLTGNGEINVKDRQLDLDGVLVPAYRANSIISDIPLIGALLGGKEGEGFLGLNYTVKGPYAATQVAVNPLSALTPGVLRGVFQTQRDDLPAQAEPSEGVALDVDSVEAEVPEGESSELETSQVDAPVIDTPETKVSGAETPEAAEPKPEAEPMPEPAEDD